MTLGMDIAVLVLLLVLSGFFSGAEVALVSLSRIKCRQMVEKNKRGAIYVKKLKDDPQRMLSTILIGNNIVNIGASAIATAIAINTFDSFALGIATGVMTLLILVFGEITPKSIAAAHNEYFSRLVAWPIWHLSIILAPVLVVLDTFLNRFMKLLGIRTVQTTISEEEIKSMIQAAEEEGSIKEIEKKMIHSIFEFDDISVTEIATPRTDMTIVESKSTIKDAFNLVLKTGHSRIPVYEKNRDNIVGIIYVKDILKHIKNRKEKQTLKNVMKPAFFVPETKKVSALLKQFQKRKEHMAVVIDEHGSVTGLVTLEDVLEEIVGEIMDETDKVDPTIKKTGAKTWMVSGRTDIDEINDKLKMKLKGEGYDTFSGFILKHTGKIPKEGEEIIYKKFKLTIKEIERNRIEKVKVEKK